MNNSNSTSANANTTATRANSTFLVKPMYEGKTFRCYESGFNATCEDSIRVIRLEDMRQEIANTQRSSLNSKLYEQFYDLRGKQPLFYLQERFAQEHVGFEWNGFLLYAVNKNKADARKVALANQDKLHIVLAFDDPDSDRYYMLIDTQTGGGTEDDFLTWRADIREGIMQHYFHKPVGFGMDYYIRASTPDHFDIIDRDVLFGNAEECGVSEVSGVSGGFKNQPVTVGEIIKDFFSHLFRKTA